VPVKSLFSSSFFRMNLRLLFLLPLLSTPSMTSTPSVPSTNPSPAWVFPDPASEGVMIFLVVYYALSFLVVVFVVAMLLLCRNHKVIVPRDLWTLIPFHIMQYALSVVAAVSIILGKPAFCTPLEVLYSVAPVFVSLPPLSPHLSSPLLSLPSLSSPLLSFRHLPCDQDLHAIAIPLFFVCIWTATTRGIWCSTYLARVSPIWDC